MTASKLSKSNFLLREQKSRPMSSYSSQDKSPECQAALLQFMDNIQSLLEAHQSCAIKDMHAKD